MTGRSSVEVGSLLVAFFLVVAPTSSTEPVKPASPDDIEVWIDRYCASVDPAMRERCKIDVISQLEGASTIPQLRLLAEALRTLKNWTDKDPELARDLRRREQNTYEAILRLRPKDAEAMYFLAVSHEDQQEENRLLREMLAVHPGDVPASRVLALTLLRNGGTDEAREAFELLSTAYKNADSRMGLLLAAEAASALGRVDPKATKKFRQTVKEDYGVYSILERATAAVESGSPVDEKIQAAKIPIDQFCSEPYLLFDSKACERGVELMLQVEESVPRNPEVLRALIAGLQGLDATKYKEELRVRIEKLIEVEGRSAELLLDYASVLEGKEQIDALESILSIDRTSSAKVHAMLGRALINEGRFVEGISQMRAAFERAKGREKRLYGSELVQALRFYGTSQDALEADRIEQTLQQS